jgi:hypothetical protein
MLLELLLDEACEEGFLKTKIGGQKEEIKTGWLVLVVRTDV